MDRSKRASNIELLRIIATIFITFNHVKCSDNALRMNFLLNRFFLCGGQFGVNIFLLVGCCFLVHSKPNKKRIIRIVSEMCFYAIFLDLFAVLFLNNTISIETIFNGFRYWFPFGYVIMLLLHPLLLQINGKWCCIISIIGGIIFTAVTVIGVFIPDFKWIIIFNKGMFIGPIWFCYVFILIKFIETHAMIGSLDVKRTMFIFLFSYFLMYFLLIISGSLWLRSIFSPVCLISAFSFYKLISSLSIQHNLIINRVARCTFGVYFFQCHWNISDWIWNGLFDFNNLSETSLLYGVYSIFACVFIFVCGFVIDFIRVDVFKSLFKRLKECAQKG